MSVSRDGRYLATISRYGLRSGVPAASLGAPLTHGLFRSQLCIWDLTAGQRGEKDKAGASSGSGSAGQAGPQPGEALISHLVPDDCTLLSFNPYNPLQICTGHSKRLTVFALSPHTPFQLPTLTPL